MSSFGRLKDGFFISIHGFPRAYSKLEFKEKKAKQPSLYLDFPSQQKEKAVFSAA